MGGGGGDVRHRVEPNGRLAISNLCTLHFCHPTGRAHRAYRRVFFMNTEYIHKNDNVVIFPFYILFPFVNKCAGFRLAASERGNTTSAAIRLKIVEEEIEEVKYFFNSSADSNLLEYKTKLQLRSGSIYLDGFSINAVDRPHNFKNIHRLSNLVIIIHKQNIQVSILL